MDEIILITEADFLPYRAVAANVDAAKRIYPHVIEAQSFDLAPLMGSHLYNDLLTYTKSLNDGLATAAASDPHVDYIPSADELKFKRLLDGCVYTIHEGTDKAVTKYFKGIKAVLVYFSYARFVLRDNIRSTPTGFAKKRTMESDPISQKEAAEESARAKAGGNTFFQSVGDFMKDSQYVTDHVDDWKKYNNDCGCAVRRSNRTHMGAVRNPKRQSRNWNRNDR